MEQLRILEEVQATFRNILYQDGLVLQPETTAQEVEDWDSLNHLHLVNAIEKHFKVRFTVKEIQSWKNVGDLVASIASKLHS
jgi:acyl carrier protein